MHRNSDHSTIGREKGYIGGSTGDPEIIQGGGERGREGGGREEGGREGREGRGRGREREGGREGGRREREGPSPFHLLSVSSSLLSIICVQIQHGRCRLAIETGPRDDTQPFL